MRVVVTRALLRTRRQRSTGMRTMFSSAWRVEEGQHWRVLVHPSCCQLGFRLRWWPGAFFQMLGMVQGERELGRCWLLASTGVFVAMVSVAGFSVCFVGTLTFVRVLISSVVGVFRFLVAVFMDARGAMGLASPSLVLSRVVRVFFDLDSSSFALFGSG